MTTQYRSQKDEKAKATHSWQALTMEMDVCLNCCLIRRALLAANAAPGYASEYVRVTPAGFAVTRLAGVCPGK